MTDANDYLAIDCDGHVHEPDECFTEYLEEAFRGRTQGWVLNKDGARRFVVDGIDHPPFPSSISARKPMTAENRLKVLDKEQIQTAVLFPSAIMSAPYVGGPEDTDFRHALIRAYNSWVADFTSHDSARLKFAAPLAIEDVAWAAEEARRAVALGAAAITLRPNLTLGRTFDDPVYDPLYQAISDLGVPLIIHETTGDPSTAAADRYGIRNAERYGFNHMISHSFEQMFACMSLIAGGVLEKFPELRVGFFEAGCSWLVYWLNRMDDHYGHRILGKQMPISKKPSEYFQAQCLVSCDPGDETIPYAIDALGAGKIAFATDYPHFDSAGGAVAEFLSLDGISPGDQRKILWDNAARFYGLD